MSKGNKEWYKLIFKQNQPIHIGKSNWGVINETEIFIPGWTMWGALTNTYLRNRGFKDLNSAKEKFETITNFFPSFDGETILAPNYKDGEFCLGDFSESEFRLFFIDTSLKTSVEPILRKAKDEHLYEFDYILPAPKKEFKKTLNDKGFKDNLFWIGLIAIEKKTAEEATKNFLKKGLKIFIGGDTRYGFGELELVKLKKINEETNGNEFKQWNIDKDGKFVKNGKDDNGDDKGLRNYFQFFKNDLKFKGELVLLPEFNFTQNVPLVEKAEFFITPGSLIIDDSFDGRSFTLKKGKFQQINQEDL